MNSRNQNAMANELGNNTAGCVDLSSDHQDLSQLINKLFFRQRRETIRCCNTRSPVLEILRSKLLHFAFGFVHQATKVHPLLEYLQHLCVSLVRLYAQPASRQLSNGTATRSGYTHLFIKIVGRATQNAKKCTVPRNVVQAR